MEYSKLQQHLSKPRLNRFYIAASNSKHKAKLLYEVNLNVSKSFYPVLNLFEIILRNNIDNTLSNYFSDPDWIINQERGFMNDRSLPKRKFLKEKVCDAKRKLKKKRTSITSGKIIAEQSLSFWTSLFDKRYYTLINGEVIKAFPEKPIQIKRSNINNKLHRIRMFRNRVYHNEPICFDNSNCMNFNKPKEIKSDIYNLVSWMDKDLTKYVNGFDSINREIRTKNIVNAKYYIPGLDIFYRWCGHILE